MITKSEQNHAFRYIYESKNGKYKQLVEDLSQEIVDKFCSVGFIKTGYTAECKTWGITSLGKQYCEDFVL